MLGKLLQLLRDAWALWGEWSARSKQQSAEQTARDMRAGAEQAAEETKSVVDEIAHERENLLPPSSDPAALAASLHARARAGGRRRPF